MSTRRMSRESTQPPKYPDINPRTVPSAPPTKIATSETTSETRAPWMIRLRMSRPSLSVPSGYSMLPPCCQAGGFSRLASEPFNGSCGATCDASTAGITRRNVSIASGTRGYRPAWRIACATLGRAYQGRLLAVTVAMSGPPSLPSLIPDAGIEIGVEDVHQQIGHDEDGGEHDDDGLDHLEVPGPHGIDHQQPGARPGEDALGDDSPRHQH